MKTGDGISTIKRINRPGTTAKNFCSWPEETYEEMDSTLAIQQYIQQLIKRDPSNIELILSNPETHDEGVWKYEHLRQFCMELNGLAVRLQGHCFPSTCTQMTATEQWIFLCAAHKTPKECPAIDYTRHTLDGAACLLNSYKYFPSRVYVKDTSVAKLGSVCRRVYRIFSHAYFHHPKIFNEFEKELHLCNRFTQFVTKYELMSRENLLVPIGDLCSNDAVEDGGVVGVGTGADGEEEPETNTNIVVGTGGENSVDDSNVSVTTADVEMIEEKTENNLIISAGTIEVSDEAPGESEA